MLGSVQLSGKAGVSVRADMETGHLEVDQPDDDRAAATAVKCWTFRLPGLVVRHGHGAAATAILLAPGIPPRQHVHSLHLSASLWVRRLGRVFLPQLPWWEVGPVTPRIAIRYLADAPFGTEECYVCMSVCGVRAVDV